MATAHVARSVFSRSADRYARQSPGLSSEDRHGAFHPARALHRHERERPRRQPLGRQSVRVRTPALSQPSPTVIEGLRVAVPAANLIGESPVWSVKEQALYWVDVEGRCVQRWHRDAVTRWEVPEPIGSLGLRCSGGLITATRSGFVFLDTANGQLTAISDPEADFPGNRFNDGKVDRNGRFWAGTKNIANSSEP